MEIKELLNMQSGLDNTIMFNKFGDRLIGKDVLTERFLAMIVEVCELANATRCFKYWSEKESETKERLLDEYADCLHFLLSIGNTLEFKAEEIEAAYLKKHDENYKRQESGY